MTGRLSGMIGRLNAGRDDALRPGYVSNPLATPTGNWELLDLLPDGALGVDPKGVIFTANSRAHQMLGYGDGELVGCSVEALLPERFRSAHVRHRSRYVARPWTRPMGAKLELFARCKDGSELPVEISLSPARASGQVYVVATIRDVSDRRRTAGLLALEKSMLETVATCMTLSESLDGIARITREAFPGCFTSILLLDPDGKRLRRAAAAGLPEGYIREIDGLEVGASSASCGTAVYRKRPVIVADISRDPVWLPYRSVAHRFGLRACWSVPLLSRGGVVSGSFAIYYGEVRAPSDEERELAERAAHVAEIAIQRARAESALRESEERYRTVSELTSDYSYSLRVELDGSLVTEWVTGAFARITGYRPDEMPDWRNLLHPDEIQTADERHRTIASGHSDVSEFRIVTKQGDVRWLRNYSRPVRDDAEGRVVRIIGAAQDVTERKEAEEAKTLFLATASHELKTPLTVIQGFAQLLSRPNLPSNIKVEALQAIERRSIQLNKIVDRILLSSRIESGRANVASCDVEVAPLLQERADALQAASGRRVALEMPTSIPAIWADPDALVTVIDHLLDNAIKYSPDGGPVVIEVRVERATVLIDVIDHGIGMTRDQLVRCFDKFWQGESSDGRRFGGTGIGLFIVRSLVEAMGGSCEVSSALGKGTRVTTTLVRADVVAAASEDTVRDGPPAPGVGDPSVIREFMRQIGIPPRGRG